MRLCGGREPVERRLQRRELREVFRFAHLLRLDEGADHLLHQASFRLRFAPYLLIGGDRGEGEPLAAGRRDRQREQPLDEVPALRLGQVGGEHE